MLPFGPSHRRQPTKVMGLVYVLLGIFGLFIAGFVMVASTRFGDNKQFLLIFGTVIALYGVFRIYTGVSIMKKAAALENAANLDGKSITSSITKVKSE
jgi:hypothetical protein